SPERAVKMRPSPFKIVPSAILRPARSSATTPLSARSSWAVRAPAATSAWLERQTPLSASATASMSFRQNQVPALDDAVLLILSPSHLQRMVVAVLLSHRGLSGSWTSNPYGS